MTNFFLDGAGGCEVTSLLLIAADVKLAMDRETRRRGFLMIAAALVMVMNVMIWTV